MAYVFSARIWYRIRPQKASHFTESQKILLYLPLQFQFHLLGIFIMILYHSRYYHFQTLIVCVVSSVTGLGLKGPTTGCAEEFPLPCGPVHVLNVSLHVLHSFVHASCLPCKTVHALKALHRWKQLVASYIPEGELLPHAMD